METDIDSTSDSLVNSSLHAVKNKKITKINIKGSRKKKKKNGNKELEILIEKGKSFVRNIFENTIGRLIDESEQAQHSVVDEIYESSLRIENVNFFIITNKAYYSESDLIGNGEINKLIYSTVVISLIDFYDFLLTGKKIDDRKLQLDDVIFIPRRKKSVTIIGEVNRNGIFELKSDESLKDLIYLGMFPTCIYYTKIN